MPYVEQGAPHGIPVVMLHGVSDSWRSFERVLPHLPDSLHVFALTQRGHGDASRPDFGYRLENFAADVAAFMDELGIHSAVVAGHSMGSSVGQRFAINFPGRTRGLVLAAAFASYQNRPDLDEFWESQVSKLTDPVDADFVRDFQESTISQAIPREFLEMAIEESRKLPAFVWKHAFQGFFEDDHLDALGTITAPTMIIWGDRDAYCPRIDQDIFLERIKGSRLLVYSGAGHAVHWEEPERFAADLVSFVREFCSV